MRHILFLGIAFVSIHAGRSGPAFCDLPVESGEGTNINYEVYYDAAKDECVPFIFNGEGGNGNRFRDEKQCMRTCSPNAEAIYPTNDTSACHLEKKIGSGRCINTILRYYYDSVHDKCVKFHWSGCSGNGNRFHTPEECYQTCIGVHDDGDRPMEDEPDTPIAIIVGVVLGIIIFALLIAVIVLTVKSTKNKKQKGKREGKVETPLQELGA